MDPLVHQEIVVLGERSTAEAALVAVGTLDTRATRAGTPAPTPYVHGLEGTRHGKHDNEPWHPDLWLDKNYSFTRNVIAQA